MWSSTHYAPHDRPHYYSPHCALPPQDPTTLQDLSSAHSPCEVRHSDTASHFSCTVLSLLPNGNLLVRYEHDWLSPTEHAPQNVRFAPISTNYCFAVGQEVEARARSADNEPLSYWPAIIEEKRQNQILIRYIYFPEHQEILDISQLRAPNPNPSLVGLIRHSINVPASLLQSYQTEDTLRFLSLKHVLQESQLVYILLRAEFNSLELLGTAESIARASATIEASLSHLIALQSFAEPSESIVESFECSPSLFGLIIGKNGSNIRAVQQQIPEILSVRCLPQGRVEITSQSLQSAKNARLKLEVLRKFIKLRSEIATRLIGRAFSGLKEIEDLSGARIRIQNDEISIVGFGEFVEIAAHLVEVSANWIELILKAERIEYELNEQLNEMRVASGVIQQKLQAFLPKEKEEERTELSSQNLAPLLNPKPSKSPILRHKSVVMKDVLSVQNVQQQCANLSQIIETKWKKSIPALRKNSETKENRPAPNINLQTINGNTLNEHKFVHNKTMSLGKHKVAWKKVAT